MATTVGKRSSTIEAGRPFKRVKGDDPISPAPGDDLDDDHDEEYVPGHDDSMSDAAVSAETPITPFSPVRRFPSDEKTIRCPYEGCMKTFNRPARLASHIRSHTNERPFVCSYDGCDKTYLEEKHLKQHIKGSHTHERDYVCDWEDCGKSFLTATRLRRHKEAHEGRERFRCTEYPPCNQTFRKHQTLQRHIRSEHLSVAAFPCLLTDPKTNEKCSAGFDSAGSLRKHQDRFHGETRFWCDECQAGNTQQGGFATKAQLQQHIRTEHVNCVFCDMRFQRSVDLQNHLEAKHSGRSLAERKTIPCTYVGCDKAFTKKSNLDAHIRNVHEGKRFICGSMDVITAADIALWKGTDACGRAFVSKANLEDHIRTQHVGLPSILNARRPKRGVEAQLIKEEKPKESISAIDELTGAGYGIRTDRQVPCTVPGCEWLFTRDFYLQNHLKTKHADLFAIDTSSTVEHLLAPTTTNFIENTPEPVLGQDAMNAFEWEQSLTLDAETPFWIGGDNGLGGNLGNEYQWMQDELEMRQLIDPSLADLDAVIDPVLQGV